MEREDQRPVSSRPFALVRTPLSSRLLALVKAERRPRRGLPFAVTSAALPIKE